MKRSKYIKKHGLPPGPIKGTDGKVYDSKNNTVDGMPPLEVGDVFFFRGIGSPHATVTKAKMTRHFGKIAVFVLLSPENGEDIGIQFYDLRRVEVVQMAAPVTAPQVSGPPPLSDEEIDQLDDELSKQDEANEATATATPEERAADYGAPAPTEQPRTPEQISDDIDKAVAQLEKMEKAREMGLSPEEVRPLTREDVS